MTIPAVIRIALVSVHGEVSRYRATSALLAAVVALGAGLAIPALSLHGRLGLVPLRGGDLGLVWRAGVQPPAAIQQEAVDALGGLLTGISLGTLAIAAVTILVLSLAREAERATELSVRRAVGAGHRILLGSALLEGGLVALAGIAAGAMVGVVVTVSMADWPGALRPATLGRPGVAALALVLVILAGAGFPVLFPRRRIAESEPHSPTPLTPSAIQIGASLIALTLGGLLARHAAGVLAARPTTPADGVVHTITMAASAPADRAHRYAMLLDTLAVRGAQASLTSPGALLGLGPVGTVTTDCGQCSEGGLPLRWRVKPAAHQFVTADTFQMLGMKVVEGRGITGRDAWGSPRVAVINRNLAAREFQNGQAIGRGIRVVDDGDQWSTVVGVVDDPPAVGLGAAMQPKYTVFLSVLQHPPATVDLLMARRQDHTNHLLAAVTSTLGARTFDRAATPVRALVAGQMTPLRWFAAQFGLQGWAMLAIAVLGTVAAARLWVTALLGDLGVRRALGARRGQTVFYVLVRAAAVCGGGIAGGVWFGQAIWTMLADVVAGLDPWDGALVLHFGLVLLLAVLAGSLPPAWRAARATPASLLSAS